MPEVRVVRDTLKRDILGYRIEKIDILYPKIIEGNLDEFIKTLEQKTFKDIRSIGKWLIFDLGEYAFLSHLRMEGKYFFEENNKQVEKHTHIIFHLNDNMSLRYNDTRKFGRIILIKTSDIPTSKYICKLGLEPDNPNLDSTYLLEKLKNKSKSIKTSLLDQTIICGLGNIYANEVLFASHINPFRKSSSITKEEADNIIENAKIITNNAYTEGGSTIRSYTSSLGHTGKYQDYLLVHGKENHPCPICGNTIKRVQLDGRSVYYCDTCQK